MKCVIYTRVSSDRQVKEGNGASSQEQRCKSYAQAKEYEFLKSFTDEGVSGAIFDRPGMQELLSYIRNLKEKSVVIIDDISRIARDVSTHIQLRAAISLAGGILESPAMKFEDNASGEFMEMVLAASAQFARKGNREQVINRQEARLQQGYWTFHAPQGYVFESHPIYKKILVQTADSTILAKGLDWYGRGSFATKRELASFLQDEGFYPLSLHITVAEKRVTRLFDCLGMYAGFIEYAPWNISQVEGKHQPLISRETFYQILARESKPAVGIQKTTGETSHFELRNFVCCIECGKPLTGSFAKGKYPRYHCYNQRCDIYGHSIKRDSITADFETLLQSLEARSELMELIGLLTKKAWSERISTWSQGAHQHESEAEKITGAIALAGHRLGQTADDEIAALLESEIKEMKTRRDQLLIKVSKFQKDPPNFEEAFNRVSTIIQDPYSYWKSGGMAQKKTVHRMVFTASPRYDRNTGFSTVSLTLPYLITSTSKNDSSRLVEVAGVTPASKAVFVRVLHAQSQIIIDTQPEAANA